MPEDRNFLNEAVFLILFFFIFIILDLFTSIYIYRPSSIINILFSLLFQLFNIGLAYRLSELALSSVVRARDLPKLNNLNTNPPVALLYVTFKDALPLLVNKLKNLAYNNYHIFILDDSLNNNYIDVIDEDLFTILRRSNRRGFKAGCINDWIKMFGSNYDYFIIADSDSMFEDNFIVEMLKYAENPYNKNIAIFQSIIIPWNNDSEFSKAISVMTKISMSINKKIANRYGIVLSWGHNNLNRIKPILEVGGIDEYFISEDFATTLNLMKTGYKCKLVNVVSYDMAPEGINAFTGRYIRWAKQTIQLLEYDMQDIPINIKFHMFVLIYNYLILLVFPLLIIIGIFGSKSSFKDFVDSIYILGNIEFYNTSMYYFSLLLILYILETVILRLIVALWLDISLADFLKSIIFHMSLGSYLMFPLIVALVKWRGKGKLYFNITCKEPYEYNKSFVNTIKDMWHMLIFNIAIVIGLILNPKFLILNIIWLAPLLFSPLVIFLFQRCKIPPNV